MDKASISIINETNDKLLQPIPSFSKDDAINSNINESGDKLLKFESIVNNDETNINKCAEKLSKFESIVNKDGINIYKSAEKLSNDDSLINNDDLYTSNLNLSDDNLVIPKITVNNTGNHNESNDKFLLQKDITDITNEKSNSTKLNKSKNLCTSEQKIDADNYLPLPTFNQNIDDAFIMKNKDKMDAITVKSICAEDESQMADSNKEEMSLFNGVNHGEASTPSPEEDKIAAITKCDSNNPNNNFENDQYLNQKCCWIFNSSYKRFIAMTFICLIGFFSMACYDLPGSLESKIEDLFQISTSNFEFLYSMYCLPNMFSYIGGILIDRVLGVKNAAYITVSIMFIGQIIFTIGGFVKMYWVLLVARFIYGIGGDTILVVVSYYSVLWFSGKELNFVFGMIMSVARMGTSFIFFVSSLYYEKFNNVKSNPAIMLGSALSVSIICGAIVTLLTIALAIESDKLEKFENPMKKENKINKSKFRLKEVFKYPFKFWLVTTIFFSIDTCVLAFVTCSQKFLMDKYHEDESTANYLGSVFNLVLAISSPFAGLLIDVVGKQLNFIILSLAFGVLSQLLLAFVNSNPYLPLVIFGLSSGILFSCVMPLTSLIVPGSILGSAYGLNMSFANMGLFICNILVGYILQRFGYRAVSLFYANLLFLGLVASIALLICDKKDGGTLNEYARKKTK